MKSRVKTEAFVLAGGKSSRMGKDKGLVLLKGKPMISYVLDTLGKTKEMIVVAIDNGGDKRLNEYAPFDMERYGKAEGDEYVAFLINTLRPYINKKYRTLTFHNNPLSSR